MQRFTGVINLRKFVKTRSGCAKARIPADQFRTEPIFMKYSFTFFCWIIHWYTIHAQSAPIQFSSLTENAFVYTTYNEFNGTLVPSNSMYFVTDAGIVVIDTPWDTTQFQPFLDSIES